MLHTIIFLLKFSIVIVCRQKTSAGTYENNCFVLSSNYIMDPKQLVDQCKTVFKSRIPWYMKASELAYIFNSRYNNVCYAGIDCFTLLWAKQFFCRQKFPPWFTSKVHSNLRKRDWARHLVKSASSWEMFCSSLLLFFVCQFSFQPLHCSPHSNATSQM